MAEADLTTHPIAGYVASGEHVSIPVISQIEGNLWMGGFLPDARLPDDFAYVVSLYPWGQYELGPDTVRHEVEMYDSHEVPVELIDHAADLVNGWRALGKTLVHCQAGLNRSGVVTAWALIKSGMGAQEAIDLLRAKRDPLVLCNPRFEAFLLAK
jgi:protein-tyrosine phosphatase